jgi:hypothetical protein
MIFFKYQCHSATEHRLVVLSAEISKKYFSMVFYGKKYIVVRISNSPSFMTRLF